MFDLITCIIDLDEKVFIFCNGVLFNSVYIFGINP